MDMLPDWAAHFLADHENLQDYAPYAHQAYSYLSLFKWYGFQLMDQVYRKPDLATILMLVAIIFISLKVFNMLWQMVMSWVRLFSKLIFWGGTAALGLWMYTRGPEGVMEDVEYWWQTWQGHRTYWLEKERAAKVAQRGRQSRNRSWF